MRRNDLRFRQRRIREARNSRNLSVQIRGANPGRPFPTRITG